MALRLGRRITQVRILHGRPMSFYRNSYLKSEEWSLLRTQALLKQGSTCQFCGRVDISNDVHHLKYKRLKDVTLSDLRVLCRACHEKLHQYQDLHPNKFHEIKNLSSEVIWSKILFWLGIQKIEEDTSIKVYGLLEKSVPKFKHKIVLLDGKPVEQSVQRVPKIKNQKELRRLNKEKNLFKPRRFIKF